MSKNSLKNRKSIFYKLNNLIKEIKNNPTFENYEEEFKRIHKKAQFLSKEHYIADGELNKFYDIIDVILKDDVWSNKFSEKYINEFLIKEIKNVLKNQIPIDKEKIIQHFDSYKKTHQCILQVNGFDIEEDKKIEIGKTKIYRFVLDELNKDNGKSFREIFQKKSKQFDGKIVFKYCNKGDINFVKDKAIKEAEIIINIIRFLILISENLNYKDYNLFIYGIPTITDEQILMLNDDDDIVQFNEKYSNFTSRIFLNKLIASNDVYDKIEELFFGANQNNNYSSILQNSILLLSKSLEQATITGKCLWIIFAIEVLISSKSSIRSTISDRVAIVSGKDKDDRIKIAEKFRNIYGRRNKYVHGQNIDFSSDDYRFLLSISTRIIKYFLFKLGHTKDLNSLIYDIDKLKFTNGINNN